ncbi:MAG TPA: diguanylate cyclase, partial [Terriglobales bacterium]|nr:diguanylate cyclase [Terriglobales bacterium]
MTNLRRQRISNWVMLGLTVAAATVSAIAITQFRQQADQYRQTELMLTRIEGQMHLLEGLEVRWEADRKNADLRRELEETRTNLRQYFRALGESRTDVSLQELSSAGDAYVNFFSEGPSSPSSTDRQYASSNLSGRVRQSSATYNEQAQTAIWKSDLEATLGLLAFVVAIATILWRFGAVRRNADLAKAEQRTLQQSEERFRTLTDNSSDIIAIVDAEGAILYLSNSIEHVLGYPRQQWDGHTVLELIHSEEAPVFAEMLHRISRTSDSRNTAEFRFRHEDGVWRHMEVTARNDLSTQNVGGIVVNARDITERKIAEEQLLHDAFHDPLTSLPNRTLLLDRLQRAVNRSRRQENYKFGLLFIDLDRFKIVNDSLGHQAGDQLIVEVASRLGNSLRQTMPQGRMRPTGDDTIARIGGDEFTVLIEEIRDPADAIRVAERILARLELPFVVNGIEMFTSASIGIAISSAPYTSADEVLRDADIAMYRAKAAGGARMEVFDGEMHSQAVHRLTLETDLRKALERQEFEVYYQP